MKILKGIWFVVLIGGINSGIVLSASYKRHDHGVEHSVVFKWVIK